MTLMVSQSGKNQLSLFVREEILHIRERVPLSITNKLCISNHWIPLISLKDEIARTVILLHLPDLNLYNHVETMAL